MVIILLPLSPGPVLLLGWDGQSVSLATFRNQKNEATGKVAEIK